MNLIGYCAEKNQHILVYFYMSRGSLASHLYSKLAIHIFITFNRSKDNLSNLNLPSIFCLLMLCLGGLKPMSEQLSCIHYHAYVNSNSI